MSFTIGGKSSYYSFTKDGNIFKLQPDPELEKLFPKTPAPESVKQPPSESAKQKPKETEKIPTYNQPYYYTPEFWKSTPAPAYMPPYQLPQSLVNLPSYGLTTNLSLGSGPNVSILPMGDGFAVQGSGAAQLFTNMMDQLRPSQPAVRVPKKTEKKD